MLWLSRQISEIGRLFTINWIRCTGTITRICRPWNLGLLKTRPPADRFIFERNPYYYRIDKEGHQLPYIDRVVLSIADSKIIPAKTGAGESDLQARYLRFDNYTFLKAGEERNHYKVRLWRTGPGQPAGALSEPQCQ